MAMRIPALALALLLALAAPASSLRVKDEAASNGTHTKPIAAARRFVHYAHALSHAMGLGGATHGRKVVEPLQCCIAKPGFWRKDIKKRVFKEAEYILFFESKPAYWENCSKDYQAISINAATPPDSGEADPCKAVVSRAVDEENKRLKAVRPRDDYTFETRDVVAAISPQPSAGETETNLDVAAAVEKAMKGMEDKKQAKLEEEAKSSITQYDSLEKQYNGFGEAGKAQVEWCSVEGKRIKVKVADLANSHKLMAALLTCGGRERVVPRENPADGANPAVFNPRPGLVAQIWPDGASRTCEFKAFSDAKPEAKPEAKPMWWKASSRLTIDIGKETCTLV